MVTSRGGLQCGAEMPDNPPVSRLNVVVWGDGERVVCVHGSLSWGTFAFRAQRPLAEARSLVLPDRRGYGMKPLGDELGELGDVSLGDPIGSLGVLADYVAGRIGRAVRPERITMAHPELAPLADSVSEQVGRLRSVTESLLRAHRGAIVERQFHQKRLASAVADIYAQVAVLSRVTDRRAHGRDRQARLQARRVRLRVLRGLRMGTPHPDSFGAGAHAGLITQRQGRCPAAPREGPLGRTRLTIRRALWITSPRSILSASAMPSCELPARSIAATATSSSSSRAIAA